MRLPIIYDYLLLHLFEINHTSRRKTRNRKRMVCRGKKSAVANGNALTDVNATDLVDS